MEINLCSPYSGCIFIETYLKLGSKAAKIVLEVPGRVTSNDLVFLPQMILVACWMGVFCSIKIYYELE